MLFRFDRFSKGYGPFSASRQKSVEPYIMKNVDKVPARISDQTNMVTSLLDQLLRNYSNQLLRCTISSKQLLLLCKLSVGIHAFKIVLVNFCKVFRRLLLIWCLDFWCIYYMHEMLVELEMVTCCEMSCNNSIYFRSENGIWNNGHSYIVLSLSLRTCGVLAVMLALQWRQMMGKPGSNFV